MKGICVLLLFTFTLHANAAEVKVAVAANFLSTLKTLAPLFEEQSDHTLLISAGSSGKLFAQIMNGAPYDVFLSADKGYPDELVKLRRAIARSRYVYAKGILLLWSAENLPLHESNLTDGNVRRLAIANPRTAPYGMAAQQVLRKLGIDETLKPRIVQGESVGQTFQFVASGNAQFGFVAASQVFNPANRFNREHYWQVPFEYYNAIEQEAVLLNKGSDNMAASEFLEFLKSDTAKRVIAESGYR